MKDIKELTQDRVEEVLAYIDESPVGIFSAINHDTLYELCYQNVVDTLADLAEVAAEELQLKGLPS